jgi:hypothetical protein
MSRKVLVTFKSFTEPVHVKKIVLPIYNPSIPDPVVLKELLFKEMLADKSIFSLGGDLNTRVEEVLIMKFDEDFQLVVDVHSSEIFLDLDRNVLVKLKKTEVRDADSVGADSIIFETAVDEEVKAGSVKRKNDELSSSDLSSETSNESEVGSRKSTDFLYSSSDSLNAQDLYNKKPRCMEKISRKASRVVGTSQILHSSKY